MTEEAILGGGCFWCLDACLSKMSGVAEVVSGYAGGQVNAPSYAAVCSGNTGHAEVVLVRFDPAVIAYDRLLRVFFSIHDPTTPNRQGHDVGSQYRSVIFARSAAQLNTARRVISDLEQTHAWPNPIITELVAPEPPVTFWPADADHQAYFARHPDQPYCQVVIAPKLAKLERLLALGE